MSSRQYQVGSSYVSEESIGVLVPDRQIQLGGSYVGTSLTLSSIKPTTSHNVTCRLVSNAKCKSFTGSAGQLDLRGKTVTVGGSVDVDTPFEFFNENAYSQNGGRIIVNGGTVSLSGSVSQQLYITNLDFTLASGVIGTAEYCSVYDSIVTYASLKMDASSATNSNAGGTNTGWEFVTSPLTARYWIATTPQEWHNLKFWAYHSGGTVSAPVPTSNENVYFDGSGPGNCRINMTASCALLSKSSDYTGTITQAGALTCNGDMSLSTNGTYTMGANALSVGGNFTISCNTFTCSTGTVEVGGNLSSSPSTFTGNTGLWTLTGSSKTFVVGYQKCPRQVTIASGASYTNATGFYTADSGTIAWNIYGTFTVNSQMYSYGSFTVQDGGVFNGSGSIVHNSYSSFSCKPGGTWSLTVYISDPLSGMGNIAGGVFSGNVSYSVSGTANRGASVTADTTFAGNLSVSTSSSGTCTLTVTNNANIECRGNVTISNNGRWTKSGGTLTINGSGNQTIKLNNQAVEDIVINKSGGRVTFTDNVTTDSFTGTDGDCDLNGYTITSNGNVTIHGDTGFRFHDGTGYSMSDGKFDVNGGTVDLHGADGDLLNIRDLDFDFATGVTGTASYCSVYDSIVTYVDTPMDADDGTNTNAGGTNTGWLFASSSTTYEEALALATTLNQTQPTQITAYNTLTLAATLNQTQPTQLTAYDTLTLANTLNQVQAAGLTLNDSVTFANTLNIDVLNNTRYWLGTTTDWNATSNWSTSPGGSGGASVPSIDDFVEIITNVTGPTLTAAAACQNLNIGDSFIGAVDTDSIGNYALSIAKNLTISGGSILYLRESVVTIGGNVTIASSSSAIAGTTEATNHVSLTGSNKTLTNNSGSSFCGFTIASGASYTVPNAIQITGPVIVSGTLTNNAILSSSTAALDRKVTSTGVLNGTGSIYGYGPFTNEGSWANDIRLQVSSAGLVGYLNGGDFNCNVEFNGSPTANRQMYWRNNNIIRGNYTITKGGSFSLTQNNSTYNPNIEFRGNVGLSVSGGSVAWTKGTGTITLGGTNNQTFDLRTLSIEDIVVNKASGLVTVTYNFTTDSFTGTSGDFDLNGKTITVGGNVSVNKGTGFRFWDGTTASMSDGKFTITSGVLTLTGASGNQLAITDLDFNLSSGVTGSATYCDVTNSVNTYVTSKIDATAASNESFGGNTGWDFGAFEETVTLSTTLNQINATQLTAYDLLTIVNNLTFVTSVGGTTVTETLTLANILNQTNAAQLTATNTLALANTLSYSITTGSIFTGDLTLTTTLNTTNATHLTAANTLALANTLGFTNSLQQVLQDTLNLANSLTCDQNVGGTFNISITLLNNLALIQTTGSTLTNDLTLAVSLNSSQSIERNTFNTLMLATVLTDNQNTQLTAQNTLALANTLTYTQATQLTAQNTLALANTLTSTTATQFVVSASLSLTNDFSFYGGYGADVDYVTMSGEQLTKSELVSEILVKGS